MNPPKKNILGWNFICCGTLKCQLCFISKLSQSHGRYLCGIITGHNIAVAKCYFRRFVCFSLLPMNSEFAWRMHVISPMHRFRWNQSVVVVGIWKFAIEPVLGDGVSNVFPNYLIFMWDTTSWCLSQTSKIQWGVVCLQLVRFLELVNNLTRNTNLLNSISFDYV